MAGWVTEIDPAHMGVTGVLGGAASEEEGLNFGELFSYVRTAGKRILDSANEQLFQGPVADCLAPDPYAATAATVTPPEALPIIAVVGSGSHEYAHMCEPLGKWVAMQGYNLLTFCGLGASHAMARAFSSAPLRKGRSLGVEDFRRTDEPTHFDFVEVAVKVPSGSCRTCGSRAAGVMGSTAHVLIVLPGASMDHIDAAMHVPTIIWDDIPSPSTSPDATTVTLSSSSKYTPSTGAGGSGLKLYTPSNDEVISHEKDSYLHAPTLRRAYRVSKFSELTRHITRILLSELPPVTDPSESDKDDTTSSTDSGDEFEMVGDSD